MALQLGNLRAKPSQRNRKCDLRGLVRDALIDAGASPELAGKAAEEAGGYETRLTVLTWMVGVNIGLTLLVFGSLLAAWSKLGDLAGQVAHLPHP